MESYYAEDTIELESVGLTIAVSHVYRLVRKEVGLQPPSLLSIAAKPLAT